MTTATLPSIDTLAARYAGGDTFKVLANEYGCSQWSIRKRFKDAGIQSRRRGFKQGTVIGRIDLPVGEIVNDYLNWMPLKQLAKKYNVDVRTISNRLRESGVKRGVWRHKINDQYFANITTEEQAYWLGLLMADGCVTYKPGRHTVRLCLKDKEHIEKLAKSLRTSAPITEIIREINGKTYHYYNLVVSSKKLCEDLIWNGVVPRKTCNHGTPCLKPELMRHFYRGYVDGDGCLYRTKQDTKYVFYVVGHAPFLKQMQRWLSIHLQQSINTKLYFKGRAARFGLGGCRRVGEICRLLYDSNCVSLDRKEIIARDMMSWLLKHGG